MSIYYLPPSDAGKMQWLNNFAAKLPNYREPLRLTEPTLGEAKKWSENFSYLIGNIENFRQYNKQVTAFKNLMRNGSQNNSPIGIMPQAPETLTLPHEATADIFGQAAKLVQLIKNSKGYNEAIGKDLGIIGEAAEKPKHDIKPSLSAELQAGKPNLKWKKAGMQGIHIYTDRGDGKGYHFLATDTQPDYLDTYPLPPAGQSAIWKYKAIYINYDEEVGQMSDELLVTVSSKL